MKPAVLSNKGKPHIMKGGGGWYCVNAWACAFGASPMQAFRTWREMLR